MSGFLRKKKMRQEWKANDGQHELHWIARFPVPFRPLRGGRIPDWRAIEMTKPTAWARIPQQKIIENMYIMQPPDAYRPGKMLEYEDNLANHEAYYSNPHVRSANRLRERHKGRKCHIVGAGPSVIGQEHDIIAVCNDPENYIIAINKATQLCPRYDAVVWCERTANAYKIWTPQSNNRPVVMTTPHANITALEWGLEHGSDVCLYNIGTWNPGSLGHRIRTDWDRVTQGRKGKLSEWFSVQETTQIAMFAAYWMGMRDWHFWGADYAWTDPERYYYYGDKPPTGEYCWHERISSGIEGAGDHDQVVWLFEPQQTIDRFGNLVWCNPYMFERAYRANWHVIDYLAHGVTVTNHSTLGFFGNLARPGDELDRLVDEAVGIDWTMARQEAWDNVKG